MKKINKTAVKIKEERSGGHIYIEKNEIELKEVPRIHLITMTHI